jgi:hypothetical protein
MVFIVNANIANTNANNTNANYIKHDLCQAIKSHKNPESRLIFAQ